MINPFQFFANFFGLLARASGVLGLLFAAFCILTVVLGVAEHAHLSAADAAYLSAITALTIGYGDIHPETPVGRVAAVALGILGIVFVGVIVAAAIKSLEQSEPRS